MDIFFVCSFSFFFSFFSCTKLFQKSWEKIEICHTLEHMNNYNLKLQDKGDFFALCRPTYIKEEILSISRKIKPISSWLLQVTPRSAKPLKKYFYKLLVYIQVYLMRRAFNSKNEHLKQLLRVLFILASMKNTTPMALLIIVKKNQ